MWITIHPVYDAVIWTYIFLNMSLLPEPLDQGSSPKIHIGTALENYIPIQT